MPRTVNEIKKVYAAEVGAEAREGLMMEFLKFTKARHYRLYTYLLPKPPRAVSYSVCLYICLFIPYYAISSFSQSLNDRLRCGEAGCNMSLKPDQ